MVRHTVGGKGHVLLLVLASLLVIALPAGGLAALIDEQVLRTEVAAGIDLIKIRRFDEAGWLNIFALEIDRTNPHVYIDTLLGHGILTEPQEVSVMARERGAVGAVNGDFFYINTSGAPIGPHVQSGEPVKSGSAGRHLGIGFPEDPALPPVMLPFTLQVEAELPDGSLLRVDGLNDPQLGSGQIVLYNEFWAERAPGADWPDLAGVSGLVHVVADATGKVVAVRTDEPGPAIPPGGVVLAGRGSGAVRLLEALAEGDTLTWRIRLAADAQYAAVIGGNPVLVQGGRVQPGLSTDVHPRTAVGYSADGTKVWLVVVDGRSAKSRGVSLPELAQIMLDLGAHHALNLDGGGSAALVARSLITGEPEIQNVPSDGGERRVPNGVGVFYTAPAGEPVRVVFPPTAPADEYRLAVPELRVAPGGLLAVGYAAVDAYGNPVADAGDAVIWSVEPETLGTLEGPGLFRAAEPGTGRIVARLGDTRAEQPVRVIGPPVGLEVTPYSLSLEPGQAVELAVTAVDALGFRAPVDPRDITWELRGEIGQIDGFTFQAAETSASGALLAHFGGITGSVLVGIGGEPTLLSDFETAGTWRGTVYPAQVRATMSFIADPDFVYRGERAVRLDYDFTTTTATRAAYVQPSPTYMQLPGRPLKLGVWVYGDGKGAWMRGQIVDRHGVTSPIDFAMSVDWVGWRYVEATIPEGTEYPISLRSIYVVETQPAKQYTGTVYFDELYAVYAPDPDPSLLPDLPPIVDPRNRPFVSEEVLLDDDTFRFVVFGDSKVEAGRSTAQGARILERSIEAINGLDVAFALYTGDLVENDNPAHYEFGKAYLDRLNVPYYFAPANHEIAGTNSFVNFERYFGSTYDAFTYKNALFIKLNTARPGLRVSDPAQWPWLIELLETADVDHVFIYMHIPSVDPMPGGTTGWSDPLEVDFFETLLAKTAERVESVYVFTGHVHGFARRARDGVQYLTTAGAGSPLYMPPDRGGFFHYTVVTVSGDEVWYEVVPLLERISVSAERTLLAPGDELQLSATGTAPYGYVQFPLTYPAQVRWTVDDETVARIDAATGRLHALAPGRVVVTVESGGLAASVEIDVIRADPDR